MKYYIYIILNKINNKIYVGKTKNPKERWQKHLSSARTGIGYFLIHRALNKYGINNFDFTIIEEVNTEEDAFIREIFWIAHYKSNIIKYGDTFGYNLTDGGEGASGHLHSAESKQKMSEASFGKPKSKEHKNALAAAHLGKILTNEHKENIGLAGLGKKRSEESKQNYSKSKLGSKNPSAKLYEVNVKIIKILFLSDTLSDAEIGKIYGVARKTISDIRLGKTWAHITV